LIKKFHNICLSYYFNSISMHETVVFSMIADNSVFPHSNANDMRVTQNLNSFGEIVAHADCSVDEKNIYIFRVYHIRIIANKCAGKQNYLLSNILRFALKICF
jgi:hypothetical protein